MDLQKLALDRAQQWLAGDYDEVTKAQIRDMIENNPSELTESFYRTLEFGTGGLRGIMGVGTNRMNTYTVGMATQGLANYLRKSFGDSHIKVAIAYDCRNNSPLFAQTAADVMAANDIDVYLFDSLRPTPELSFAIRHLGCKSGIVVTASHNPKEYNGYKAYWEDGGQVTTPHDTNIIDEVNSISDFSQVKMRGGKGKVQIIGMDVDKSYLEMIKALSLSPDSVARHADMKIVYTPLHGTGVRLVPMSLHNYGFTNIVNVAEQDITDGNFPTVVSPNPEEQAAMAMGVAKAIEVGAEMVMATDPDADRQALAVKNHAGEFLLLNGNQTGSLLTYYVLRRHKERGTLKGNEFVVKTIVTTEMIAKIAESFGVKYYDVLTGFKFIAEQIREVEATEKFLCGGEESFGFLIGDAVRDKDAVASLAMAAECAAWAKDQGLSMFDLLCELYLEYGFYKEGLLSITRKGISGIQEIQDMMTKFRENPPKSLCGSDVCLIKDYQRQIVVDVKAGEQRSLDGLPKSNVLQFVTQDGTIVSVRPSGTEPKIKFYFGVREELNDVKDYDVVSSRLDEKIERLKKDLGL